MAGSSKWRAQGRCTALRGCAAAVGLRIVRSTCPRTTMSRPLRGSRGSVRVCGPGPACTPVVPWSWGFRRTRWSARTQSRVAVIGTLPRVVHTSVLRVLRVPQVMSSGFIVPQDKSIVWRGPMVMGAVNQVCGWGRGQGCIRTAVQRRRRGGTPPWDPLPPLPMVEADSQNIASGPSVPRGFTLQKFWPAFGGGP